MNCEECRGACCETIITGGGGQRVNIADFRGTQSGPVALLGNGPSLSGWDLSALAERMPLFGINRSWKIIETPWRCYVDEYHHEDIRLGRAPAPEIAFTVRDPNRLELPCLTVEVPWTPITQETPKRRFCGAELDRGSFGPFAGYFALEIARWMGFNPIYLLGYDGDGGHFDEPGFHRPEFETRTWNELFREARTCLDRDGVRVVNCSPSSAIDAFEFVVDTEPDRGRL